MFDNPVDYLNELAIITPVDGSNFPYKGQIPIRFCRECIEESIKKYGFGYLKSAWLSNVKCGVHDVPLAELTNGKRKGTIIDLREILAGRPTHNSKEVFELFKGSHLYQEKISKTHFHIMPCLLMDFYMWASKENSDPALQYEYLDFRSQYSLKKDISDTYLHQKYIYFEETYPIQFKAFLEIKAELKEYKFSLQQKFSLREMLLKSKNKNCSKCSRWGGTNYCPIKPIKLQRLVYEFNPYQEINICDLRLKYGNRSVAFY